MKDAIDAHQVDGTARPGDLFVDFGRREGAVNGREFAHHEPSGVGHAVALAFQVGDGGSFEGFGEFLVGDVAFAGFDWVLRGSHGRSS